MLRAPSVSHVGTFSRPLTPLLNISSEGDQMSNLAICVKPLEEDLAVSLSFRNVVSRETLVLNITGVLISWEAPHKECVLSIGQMDCGVWLQ